MERNLRFNKVFHKHPNAKGWTFPDKLKDGRDNNCRDMVDVGTKFEIIFKTTIWITN
jgi:hypothetical protein